MARPTNVEALERMLEAAHKLIYERGFKGVSMDTIAEAAKVKKPTLFHYFPTKESLGLAVFEHATQGFHERWASRLSAEHDPISAVERMFDDTREGMEQCACAGGCFVGNLAQELSDHSERIRRKVAEHLQAWQAQFTDYFAACKAAGWFSKDFEPEVGAQSVLSLYEGALLFAKATRRPDALDNAKKMAVGYLAAFRKG
jgi:TetR/AcrR family transcriptional regulator, transcriptional repressor for nem operon